MKPGLKGQGLVGALILYCIQYPALPSLRPILLHMSIGYVLASSVICTSGLTEAAGPILITAMLAH